ncbi:protein of unknown function [Streptococcus thermophilus]|uniref:Uncharacterized protein n=1 Tax=Streptococcus thermophilus TaxID=1308 RepID=A0AAU9H736_STRTR|nr:protein of unknown function [Streptococcus thermophilus]CAD0130114.1 protein of unknown function [Streptococcus thermophilus]CAD0141637.1 protein of unknown function [Streptococcus thermophilus]CAD0147860.1 protein of unknown function [Streptococcus thermophilus]CAD0149874.1 protein of unknown function [Streptococcus thermophilus]
MQLYYNGFIPFCVYTTYFTLPMHQKLLIIMCCDRWFFI